MFRPHAPARRIAGFTLLELMITVAIVGVLASSALPAYYNYVRRSRAAEAWLLLDSLRTAQVIYFESPIHGNYHFAASVEALDWCAGGGFNCNTGKPPASYVYTTNAERSVADSPNPQSVAYNPLYVTNRGGHMLALPAE